jgi:hypothetical protein
MDKNQKQTIDDGMSETSKTVANIREDTEELSGAIL